MRENDLLACQPRAYKVTTVGDEDTQAVIADHVKRHFTALLPGASSWGTSPTSAPGKDGCTWPP